jgi:DNA-binding transcriptional regulator GbsR (MarR family)
MAELSEFFLQCKTPNLKRKIAEKKNRVKKAAKMNNKEKQRDIDARRCAAAHRPD